MSQPSNVSRFPFALADRDRIVKKGLKPKAKVEIPEECAFNCWACEEQRDLIMCWDCGYFFCSLCLPHRSHEK